MQSKNEKVKELYQKLVDRVQNFRNTEEYVKFLKFIKRFHNYSFSNKLLIYSQFEDATRVAGYKTWESLGRKVIPGSKGIQILCPRPFKVKVRVKDSEDNEKEETRELLNFSTAYVFDISQTEGDEVPEIQKNLNTNNKKELLKCLTEFSQFPIKYLNMEQKGYFHMKERYIAINKNLSIDDKVSVLLHEMTHGIYDDFNYQEERELSEIFVESVAFIVADYFDLDTSICSFRYVNNWANNDTKKVIDLGTKVQSTANSFIEQLEFSFSKKSDTLNNIINNKKTA